MFHISQDDDLVPLITYDKYTLKAEGTGKMYNPGTQSTLDIDTERRQSTEQNT